MVDAAPFAALRYDPAVAGDPAATSAPAYDLLDPVSYLTHRTASPYTVLELLAPDGAYRRSAELYERWRRSGVLVPESPAVYRYLEREHTDGGPTAQRGVLAAVRLEELGHGAVLPHEEIDTARMLDRLHRLEALPAELDPVYMILEDPPGELSALLAEVPAAPPVVVSSDEQGIDHLLWAWRERARLTRIRELLAGVRAVIADGHHRYARSLVYRDRQRARHAAPPGVEPPWERALAYLVDPHGEGTRVEAVHRLLAPVAPAQLAVLEEDFRVEAAPSDPTRLLAQLHRTPGRAFGLLTSAGAGRLLRARDDAALGTRLPAGHSQEWRQLDTAVVTHALLPRLGLAPGAVTYRSDARQAAAEVTRLPDAALLLLRPTPMQTVLRLAGARELLPYKSTRFAPKPRAGLLLRPLDPV